jgi:hypothetical protein
MSRIILPLCVTAALFAAQSATADVWIDDKLRSLTLQAPGLETTDIAPNGHDADQAAALFRRACFSDRADRTSIAAMLSGNGWGFKFVDKMMPFKDPVNIGGFYAPDAVLNASEGIFFNKVPQCNLLVRTVDPFQREIAEAALAKAVGAEPSNIAEATKKGKANKSYQPKWSITKSDGTAFTVTVRASVADPTVTHFAALQEVKKK